MSEGQNPTIDGQNPASDRNIAAEGLVGLRRAATAYIYQENLESA